MALLQEWCIKIERYLDDSDRSRWETPESGPDTELIYWRNRTQRLTSITEQLKGKAVKAVLSVLSSASRFGENEGLIDFQRVSTLLSQWKEIDVQITEAAITCFNQRDQDDSYHCAILWYNRANDKAFYENYKSNDSYLQIKH